MLYSRMKLYRIMSNLIIPPVSPEKSLCFAFFGENVSFLNTYRRLGIKKTSMKNVFVPKVFGPAATKLTPTYKKAIKDHKLLPTTGPFGDYSAFDGQNFFFDYTNALNMIIYRYKIKNFKSPEASKRILPLLNTLTGVPDTNFERVLLYCVSVDEPISPEIINRRFFIIYRLLQQWFRDPNNVILPFDKVLMFIYGASEPGKYILIFDKNSEKNQLNKLKSILVNLKMANPEEEEEEEIDNASQEIVVSLNTDIEKTTSEKEESLQKTEKIVHDFIVTNPEISGFSSPETPVYVSTPPIPGRESYEEKRKKENILAVSVLSHTLGDPHKALRVVKNMENLSDEDRSKVINQAITYAIPKLDSESSSRNPITTMSNPIKLTDNSNPRHIYEKRKKDFKESLQEDMVDAFRVLENKPLPLNFESIRVKTVTSPPSELNETINDQYTIRLTDREKNNHEIVVDLPHLTENGTFMVNGQQKIIVNQLITYPIFFFGAYSGKFSSSYSTIAVYSKILKKASYLMIFMCGIKCPLIMYLSYKEGFDETLKRYGVSYEISDQKTEKTVPLPNGKHISFKAKNTMGQQLAASFFYSLPSFPKENFDLTSSKYWKTVLERFVGNRNCTYLMDQVWQNIVTPVEVKLLQSRGDPINISDIIRYISSQVVQGRVDDRNTLDRQRIRTSEVFVALLQKQILAAYNEYEAKREAGDKNAKFFIDPTKTFSQVINSQNVQALENINPLEELACMARVTPIGIGGISNSEAYPAKALNIHDTYFGNIDPLETPDGPNVGIQQHLAIGANITNIRGTFMQRDRDKVNPTQMLSTGPAMIPFVESNEGARVTMAVGQAKQAIPLENPEVPCIQSGYESILTPSLSTSFIKKSPVDGVVLEISDKLIVVEEKETGEIFNIDITPITLKSGQGKNGLSIFKPTVSVGAKVKKSQILAEGANIKDGLISNGVNMLVAFMPWKGYNFEDGMVISESAAKKFVSVHVEEYSVILKEGEDVVNIVEPGANLSKGSVLITYTTEFEDVESHRFLRAEWEGKVVNIEIFSNLPEDELPENLIPLYNDFKQRYKKLKGSYPVGSFKEKGVKIKGILIRFTVQESLSLTKGDKLNNRHFNKGVVSIIEKDENMPVTPWGDRIDMIYNPLGVLNRMITGQILEMHTGLISKTLANEMIKKPRKQFESLIIKVFDLLDGTKGKIYSKSLIKNILSLSDKSYQILVDKVKKDKFFPLIFVPFKSPDRKDIEKALSICGLKPRYELYLPEFKTKTDPVAVGYVYVLKLEHIAEKKIHARGVGRYMEGTLAPTSGKKLGGGQQLGEYDVYSLIAWDCPVLVDEFFGASSSDHTSKNQIISEIIQTGEGRFQKGKTNPVKNIFTHLMLAIHLVS